MMEPLLDPGDEDFEKDLLAAGRDVRLSPEARARTLAALGVGAAAVATSTTAKAGMWTWLSTKSVALWMTVGGLGIAGVVATGVALSPPAAVESPPGAVNVGKPEQSAPVSPTISPPRVGEPRSTPPTVAQTPVAKEERKETLVQNAKPKAARAKPRSVRNEKPISRKSEPSRLGLELAQISRVETALRAGNGGRALALLDEYRKKFSSPLLGLEAEVLTVQALALSGNQSQASRRAAAFIARYPNSPLTSRVRKHAR